MRANPRNTPILLRCRPPPAAPCSLGPALANHEQRSCFRPGPTHPPEANRPLAAVLSPLLAAVGHFCVGLPARAEGHDDVKAVVDRVLFGRTPVPLSGASAAGGQQPRKGGLLRGAFVQRVSSLRAEGGSTAAAAPPPPPTPQQHTGVPGNSNTAVSCLFALRLESALLNAVGEVLKPFATFGPEDFIHGIFRCGLAVAGMSLNDPPAAGGGNGANSDSDDPAAAAAFAWPEPAQSLTIAADDALRAVGRGGGREKFDRRNKELAARAAGVVSCVAQSHGALFRGFLEGIRDEVVARAVASVRGACAEVGGGPPVPPSSLLGGGRRRRDEAILEILTDIVRIFADHSVACGPDFASLAPPPPPPPLLPAPASAGGEGAAADGGNAPSSTAAAASGGRRGRRITRALVRFLKRADMTTRVAPPFPPEACLQSALLASDIIRSFTCLQLWNPHQSLHLITQIESIQVGKRVHLLLPSPPLPYPPFPPCVFGRLSDPRRDSGRASQVREPPSGAAQPEERAPRCRARCGRC